MVESEVSSSWHRGMSMTRVQGFCVEVGSLDPLGFAVLHVDSFNLAHARGWDSGTECECISGLSLVYRFAYQVSLSSVDLHIRFISCL